MSLTVTRAKVKAKASISSSSYDTAIDDLIADLVPVISFALRDEVVADSTSGLVATLNVAATEIVAGEILAQVFREPGKLDFVKTGDNETFPFRGHCIEDPFALISKGWKRLRPYLKLDPKTPVFGGVLSSGGKNPEDTGL